MNNKNNNAIQESVQTLGEAIRTRVPELGDHDGQVQLNIWKVAK